MRCFATASRPAAEHLGRRRSRRPSARPPGTKTLHWSDRGAAEWTIRSLNELGNVLTTGGRPEDGITAYHEAFLLARAHGDARAAIVVTENIAETLLEQGRCEEARLHYERGLCDAEALGYLYGKANALAGLGQVDLAEGHDAAAATALREALRQAGEMGHRQLAAQCLRGLAVLAADGRDAGRAARLDGFASGLEESLGVSTSLSFRPELEKEARAFARDELGEDAFERSRENARAMDFDEAAQYALSSID